MTEKVRVGVVGTSGYADWMHLSNLKSHQQAEITAICGRNRDRAQEMADKYDVPRVFTDYLDMIRHGDLQALVVATPDDLHYPITMAALDAGLHVLCEKPLALSAAQAREMYEKAEAMGVKHMTFFTYRWLPGFQYARELIEQGYLGRPYQCHIRYLARASRDDQYQWRFDGQRSCGTLGDFGSHMIDLARWYVGDIARVCAHLSTFVERSGPDGTRLQAVNDAALLLLEFRNGAQGAIQLSTVAHVGDRFQQQHVILHGEAGTLELDFTWVWGWTLRGARSDEEQIRPLAVPPHLWEDDDPDTSFGERAAGLFRQRSIGTRLFIDGILEGHSVSPSFLEGLKVQEVIDAAIESHRSACWV